MAGEYVEFVNNSQPALNEDNLNLMQQLIKQDIQGAVSGDTLPVGAIMPFGSDTIPENWLLCNGQAVSRTDYQDLFNTIGTTFGQGDGFTTFNLPNLQGRTIVGKDANDTDFDVLGETNGEKTVKLIPQNYAYNSWQSASLDPDVGGSKIDKMISASDQATYGFHTRYGNENVNTNINNLQPYQVQNYIIKAKQSAGVVAQVIDNLNSTSTTDALSSKQGNVIKEKAIGIILYDDANGTLGTVTLSDAAENYDKIEIFYKTNTRTNSIRLEDYTGKRITLSFTIVASNAAVLLTKEIEISGTSITVNGEYQYMTSGGGTTPTNTVYIFKVVGYK